MEIWSSLSRLLLGEKIEDGKGRRLLERNWWKLDKAFPLATGGGVTIVGESACQNVFQQIIGGRWRDGVYWQAVAQILASDYDDSHKSAVIVTIDGMSAGQIPEQHVSAFRAIISEAEADRLPVICKAVITGGCEEARKVTKYGLTLDVSLPLQRKMK
ncbi:hypothetical protein [Sphingomonas sp. TZW2008]|uniref:hypothetical protein n=1 Tax=Sphingomonas sp. TZW2008 TaxID=1917973 RepID=UPI001181A1C9|nr:hypothetical protein [Sphingomonas sp. TZW2008]